ncbi:MAG: hypothetical protein V3U62_03850 [Sedimenticolaceae bacterium]
MLPSDRFFESRGRPVFEMMMARGWAILSVSQKLMVAFNPGEVPSGL